MGRRYATLEGKEVEFVRWDGVPIACICTGAEWKIGLTLQTVKDKMYVMCLNGPKSPVMKGQKFNHSLHGETMRYVYDCIKSGKPVETSKVIEINNRKGYRNGSGPSAETCAFSQ